MRRLALLGLTATLAMGALGGATATHGCNGRITVPYTAFYFPANDDPATPEDERTVQLQPIYLDDRSAASDAIDSVWVYQESNKQPGLQSGGTSIAGYSDPCSHDNPDTLVF